MADPICRWRNVTVKQVCEFTQVLPHEPMEKALAHDVIKKNWFEWDGSNNFFKTPYQLAVALGLYYEDNETFYPRFDHALSFEEAKTYILGWVRRYYVPNPYTESVNENNGIFVLNSLLQKIVNDGQYETLREALEGTYGITLGNEDIIKNMLNTFSDVQVDEEGKLSLKDDIYPYPTLEIQAVKGDKKAFFDMFNDIPLNMIHYSTQSKPTIQKIYYGTPGSGKSFKVSKEVGETPYRTIFHPDSDYASFVGSYKPVGEGNDIGYSFVEQVFTTAYIDAWKHPEKHVNLVIEEINRGNCAQIFGDLFQLLDRKNGYSEYPVTPNKDLQGYLAKSFSNEEEPFVTHGYKTSVEELVKKGIKMVLPSNLSIIATMNTSDQSLFPMDSAFKRRWEWEYVPVCYEAVTEDGNPNDAFGFMIDLGNGQPYRWIDFLKGVNIKIKRATDSEDKQMGNFFIKSNVDASTFVNKVMFYLWSEVCKDEYHTTNNFFRYDNANGEEIEFSFNELYPLNGKALEILSSFVSKMINFGNPNVTV